MHEPNNQGLLQCQTLQRKNSNLYYEVNTSCIDINILVQYIITGTVSKDTQIHIVDYVQVPYDNMPMTC